MPKPLHEMSSWDASAHPSQISPEEIDAEWESTRQIVGAATQLMRDKDEYLAEARRTVGRQVGQSQWELFVSCEPADAMQQQFEALAPEFIVLHDIGTQSSRRMLLGLAAAMGAPVHQLHIRRQGLGMPLARLEFVELPLVDPSAPALRLYTTETDADTNQRRRLARTLLAFSRLGVVMVGDLPPHALASALQPLQEAIAQGPWVNRELLMLPLSGASTLASLASRMAGRSGVQVRTTPLVKRPSEAWDYLKGAWHRLRDQLAGDTVHVPAIGDPVPAAAATPATTAPAAEPAVGERAPLPMQPMPVPRALTEAPVLDRALSAYLRQCGELKGVVSCCLFELATQRTLGHVGGRPGPAALASHGASLMASMAEAAHGLGLGDGAPDAAITYPHHHELLRIVPARKGLAMHMVLDKGQANLTLVRLQLQRLDLQLEESAAA
ncbi:MAG TPA: hypothetical protein VFQ16_12715 [Burkholderiaceae bacterium]|nr:hypothetical protein [Burkholderiaceae bacterium]